MTTAAVSRDDLLRQRWLISPLDAITSAHVRRLREAPPRQPIEFTEGRQARWDCAYSALLDALATQVFHQVDALAYVALTVLDEPPEHHPPLRRVLNELVAEGSQALIAGRPTPWQRAKSAAPLEAV